MFNIKTPLVLSLVFIFLMMQSIIKMPRIPLGLVLLDVCCVLWIFVFFNITPILNVVRSFMRNQNLDEDLFHQMVAFKLKVRFVAVILIAMCVVGLVGAVMVYILQGI